MTRQSMKQLGKTDAPRVTTTKAAAALTLGVRLPRDSAVKDSPPLAMAVTFIKTAAGVQSLKVSIKVTGIFSGPRRDRCGCSL